jgi:hypothetical protein
VTSKAGLDNAMKGLKCPGREVNERNRDFSPIDTLLLTALIDLHVAAK